MHASVRWGVRCVLRPQHSNRWRYGGLQDDLQRKFNQRAAALEAADAERADEISALKASLARSQAAAEAAQTLFSPSKLKCELCVLICQQYTYSTCFSTRHSAAASRRQQLQRSTALRARLNARALTAPRTLPTPASHLCHTTRNASPSLR